MTDCPSRLTRAAAHRVTDLFTTGIASPVNADSSADVAPSIDHAIDREKFAGFDEQLVCRLNFINRDFHPPSRFRRRSACFGATLSNDSIDLRVR